MTRIIYLDSSTVDAGDVDLTSLESLGETTLHPTTKPDQVLEHAASAEILLTNKVVLSAETIRSLPDLKYIVVTATGTNNVDLEAAKAAGIPVSNVSGYSTESVAQHVLGMMLNLATSIHLYAGEPLEWAHSPIFTRLDYPMRDLEGKTLGIVGLGSIGSRVAELAEAFRMNVIALARNGVTQGNRVAHAEFFASVDYVSLHCPLTPENTGFINESVFETMKPSAYLINTGRGPLVNESDLLNALKNRTIAGAALDVLSVEPPAKDHPLLIAELPNLFITPHTAWATTESRMKLMDGVVKNISAFLAGSEVPNRVA